MSIAASLPWCVLINRLSTGIYILTHDTHGTMYYHGVLLLKCQWPSTKQERHCEVYAVGLKQEIDIQLFIPYAH